MHVIAVTLLSFAITMSLKSLSREESLGLLSSMGVNLPRKTKLPDAELEKRVTKARRKCLTVSGAKIDDLGRLWTAASMSLASFR